MTSLSELVKALEEAPEGSRELDARIWVAIGLTKNQEAHCRSWCRMDGRHDLTREQFIAACAPTFSTSLDSAMMLVPERGDLGLTWRFFLERKPMHTGPAWFCTTREHAKDGWASLAYTAPLAVTVAALRARALSSGRDGEMGEG